MATHAGYQYVGYYDGDRQVCIGRRKLPLGKWEVIRFADYKFKSNDSHNTISIGISPADGTIHMAFDHHVHSLHYRVSKNGVATNPETTKWQASVKRAQRRGMLPQLCEYSTSSLEAETLAVEQPD